ncbi:MAG: hypothetical protein HY053_06805, partial [Proteobacteria bacterium]|nr:hypothetical protein [Pseudomonadota bacterium]
FLRFIERARTEMLRAIDASHAAMMHETKTQFVVRRCVLDYLKPAHLDEELTVRSDILECGGASLSLQQEVWRGNTLLVRAEIGLACINGNSEPCRIPAAIRGKIDAFIGASMKASPRA